MKKEYKIIIKSIIIGLFSIFAVLCWIKSNNFTSNNLTIWNTLNLCFVFLGGATVGFGFSELFEDLFKTSNKITISHNIEEWKKLDFLIKKTLKNMKKINKTLMKKLIILIVILGVCFSCTKNQRAKKWGGTGEYILLSNHKFINATWKDDNLWVLSQDTITKDFYFREKSSYGILEGKIIFKQEK